MRTFVVSIVFLLCLFIVNPVFSQDFSIHDYRAFGMVFSKQDQVQVNETVAYLLKCERDHNYWAGSRQEDVIRSKVKKYFAIVRKVYPGQSGEDDNSTHRAVKLTNEYLQKWCSEQPEIPNRDAAKVQAAQRYEKQREHEQQIAEGRELLRKEKAELQRQENAHKLAEKNAWQERVDRQQAVANQKQAQEAKGRECKSKCQSIYGDRVAFYACYNMCMEHEEPPTPSRNQNWSLPR